MRHSQEILARFLRQQIEARGFTVATFQIGEQVQLRAIDIAGNERHVSYLESEGAEGLHKATKELARLLGVRVQET